MLKRLVWVVLLLAITGACSTPPPSPVSPTTAVMPSPAAATDTAVPTPVPPTDTPVPPTDTPEPTATATEVPKPYGPEDFPAGINPLTGLKVSDPALLNRRPMAVKIQTFPRGQRPPWGVTLADIVYDYYQNNGLTRLTAIFYGQDAEQVGPIRSGRLFDSHIVRMYKSLFAFGGADRRILNRLVNAEFADRLVMEGSQSCPPMCRIDPNGFNFLVTRTADLVEWAKANGVDNTPPNLNGMRFDPQSPMDGTPVEQVYIRYSISAYNRWDYDATTGRYLRFIDNAEDSNGGEGEVYVPMIDRLNEQQVAFDNVVVLYVPHSYAYRSGASEIVDIVLEGTGKAVAFRDGQAYEVTWNRPAGDDLLFLTFPDGSRYPFKPGQTWFEVVGQTTQVKEDNAVWRFTFGFP